MSAIEWRDEPGSGTSPKSRPSSAAASNQTGRRRRHAVRLRPTFVVAIGIAAAVIGATPGYTAAGARLSSPGRHDAQTRQRGAHGATLASVSIPVLPSAFAVRPKAITQGASHSLFGLRWSSWGGIVAAARGKGDEGAGAAATRILNAVVEAFDPGQCEGHRVYRALWVVLGQEAYVERLSCRLRQYLGESDYYSPTTADHAHCPATSGLALATAAEAIRAAKPAPGFVSTASALNTDRTLGDRFLASCGPAVARYVWLVDEHPEGQACHACDSHIYIAARRVGGWIQFGWFAY